ncbi:MAG: hypothetical protein RLZZ157_1711, partial [Pseudomonadota bacterium]
RRPTPLHRPRTKAFGRPGLNLGQVTSGKQKGQGSAQHKLRTCGADDAQLVLRDPLNAVATKRLLRCNRLNFTLWRPFEDGFARCSGFVQALDGGEIRRA